MRAAIYARYSSDNQRKVSLDDQIRQCKEFAVRENFQVDESHIYKDGAISGAIEDRPELKRLEAATKAQQFDAILVDDLSRLSRDSAYMSTFLKRVEYWGITLFSVTEGVRTSDKSAKFMIGVKSLMNEEFLVDLGRKTRRGQTGQIHRGYIASSLGYGYRTEKVGELRYDNNGRARAVGSKGVVDHEEAEIIRRVFQEYASGKSIAAIVKDLNAEDIPTHSGNKPRNKRRNIQSSTRNTKSFSWNTSTVSRILKNEKYIGHYVWGKNKYVRNPETQKKEKAPLPENQWLRAEMEELRIVDQDLWDKVQKRIKESDGIFPKKLKKAYNRGDGSYVDKYPPQLLSGNLECSSCGGSIGQVTGNHGGYYGCLKHPKGACSNDTRVRREILEKFFIQILFSDYLIPGSLEKIGEKIKLKMQEHFSHLPKNIQKYERKLRDLTKKRDRFIDLIGRGQAPDSIVAEVGRLDLLIKEAELDIERAEEAAQGVPDAPSIDWITEQVKNLKNLLEQNTEQSALMVRKLFGKIVLEPCLSQDNKKYYKAHTKLNTLSLLHNSETSTNSGEVWRWGESNPRPRSRTIDPLHV